MTWTNFASSMTGSLAWPLAAVALGFMLRRAIVDLLARIDTVEAGGVKLSVAARAVEAVAQLDPAEQLMIAPPGAPTREEPVPDARPPEGGSAGISSPTGPDEAAAPPPSLFAPLAREADGAGIVRATWGRMQHTLRRLLTADGSTLPGPLTDKRVLGLLQARDIISPDTAAALEELRVIKNDVVANRTRANYVDGRAFETSANVILAEIVGHSTDPRIASAISGQGELATLNYDQLLDRLKKDFPISR